MSWQNKISPYLEKELRQLLLIDYGLDMQNYERIDCGYSNLLYLIKTESDYYIVRVSHYSKKRSVIKQEEYILENLEQHQMRFNTPKILYTIDKNPHSCISIDEKYIIHVFHYIQGNVKYKWYEVPKLHDLNLVVNAYKELNNSLKKTPTINYCDNYLNNYQEVLTIAEERNWTCIRNISIVDIDDITSFYKGAKQILAEIEQILPKFKKQFVHEDFQLENILFKEDEMTGIIDFEHAQYGFEEIDAIFSAFRICKKGKSDIGLDIDTNAFSAFIELYFDYCKWESIIKEVSYNQWLCFFALQQALLYIKNSINGIWILEEGIGFLPCFNTVKNYTIKGTSL